MAVVHVQISTNPVTKLITVQSPYNPEFTIAAKAIGGRWQGIAKCWGFPAGQEQAVHALCMKVYGTINGAPVKMSRADLESKLAMHLTIVVEIQQQLADLDGEAQP